MPKIEYSPTYEEIAEAMLNDQKVEKILIKWLALDQLYDETIRQKAANELIASLRSLAYHRERQIVKDIESGSEDSYSDYEEHA